MATTNLPARLVEIESMLDRSRRRFEEGTRLVEDAHKLLGDVQQAILGSPRTVSPEDSEEAASRLLASLKATGSEMPESLCGGRLSVDQVQRLIRIDGHPIGITEMEYRVLELLAFARNNVVTRQMLLKHLYRRADDQPQPKIIDVFISKLRKKLRNASGGAEFIETIPQRGWILRDVAPGRVEQAGLAGAARCGAAEQGVDRLLLRFARRQARRPGDRRRQAEVGRDDQRRIARDRELVGGCRLAPQNGTSASGHGRSQHHGGQKLTHVRSSPRGRCPVLDPYG
jgi:DNA-binding response OmpR family regulator